MGGQAKEEITVGRQILLIGNNGMLNEHRIASDKLIRNGAGGKMHECFGCVIYKHVKECHYKKGGRDCRAIRKALSKTRATSINKRKRESRIKCICPPDGHDRRCPAHWKDFD